MTRSKSLPLLAVVTVAAFTMGCQSELYDAGPVAKSAAAPAAEDAAPARVGRDRGELGEVTVSGGAVDDATQVAAAMMPAIRGCQARWSPRARGDLSVSAKIGPVGEVRMAKPDGDPLPEMLTACVRAKVASAKFSPPTGTDPTVVIPIRFRAE